MQNKHWLLTIFIFLSLTSSVLAQYRWDYGVMLGASNYLGEIGGQENTRRDFVFDMKLNRTQYAVGAFGRYKITPQLSANVGFNYARLTGNDYNSKNPARVARNLSFRNNIFELAGRMELTIFYDNDVGGRGYYNPDFKMYLFLGAGVIHHNPKVKYEGPLTEYNNQIIDLQPLMTEGVNYNLWQFTLPAGLGLYFTYNKIHRFGWEIGYRTTFTDYLDDVSTSYARPDQMSQTNNELAVSLANRTNDESLANASAYAEQYGLDSPNKGSFAPGEKRGDVTNNDGYILTQFSYSYVIKGRSSFYKKRYSWIKKKQRKRRKSRAKF